MKRTLRRILILVLFFAGFSYSIEVHAETKTAELITTENEEDLVVMFMYDKEIVDIAFVAPDGTEYTENSSGVETSSGELWKTYRIKKAKVGTWKVEYDLKGNAEIRYSIIEDSVGLWIQYVNIVEQSMDAITLSFMAENDENDAYYNYVISAIDTRSNDNFELISGNAKSGKDETISFSLANLTSGNYKIQLQVYYNNGIAELFDSVFTDEFSYVNSNTPESIEDIVIKIDSSNLTCTLDWQDALFWKHEEYKILVTADNEKIFDSIVDTATTGLNITYPKASSEMEVFLYYKMNSIWSEPLVRKIELNKEFLYIDDVEVTNQGQVTLNYLIKEENYLHVLINEKSGEYNISGEGSISFDLNEGINDIYAYFQNSEQIIYLIDKEIYYDAYPPTITLYDDINNKCVNSETFDIIGTIHGGEKLLLNGEECVIETNGNFCIAVDLQQGENVFTLEAVDANGNSSIMSITIYKGLTSENKNPSFIFLIVSFVIGIMLAIVTIIIGKKKNNKETNQKKDEKILYAIVVVIDVTSSVAWYALNRYVNSVEFLDLAEKSVNETLIIIVLHKTFMLIAILITLALVVIIVIKNIFRKKMVRAVKQLSPSKKQQEIPEEGYRFCTQCGKKIKTTARFCSGCGHTVKALDTADKDENDK